MSRSVPILMYHRVGPPLPMPDVAQPELLEMSTVSPDAFAAQMAWLAERGYRTVTLDDLLDHRDHKVELPARSVVITFDDGYQDCVEHAIPVMQRYGFTAIFFLVPGQVGKRSEWDHRSYGWDFTLFDWDTARELKAQGFHFGAHTMTHPHLPELSRETCRREIEGSRRALEDQLNQTVDHFCYPYGEYNEAVRSVVDELRFRSACSVRKGTSPADDDPLALRRIAISGWDTPFDFRFRLMGLRPPRQWPRQGLIRVRERLTRFRQTVYPVS